MQLATSELTVAICLLLTAEVVPLALDCSTNSPLEKLYEEKQENNELVKLLKNIKHYMEKKITTFENTAKCPFKTFTSDGFAQVVCDFSRCKYTCQSTCYQAFIFFNPSTREYTIEEPTVEYKKVYIGCIVVEKNGIESTQPQGLI
jgi:hypothetical protein